MEGAERGLEAIRLVFGRGLSGVASLADLNLVASLVDLNLVASLVDLNLVASGVDLNGVVRVGFLGMWIPLRSIHH